MKAIIGVFCLDKNDFKSFTDFYLSDTKIINDKGESNFYKETNNIIYYGICDPKTAFHGFHPTYFIFTSNAYRNKDIISLIEKSRPYTYLNKHLEI